MRILIQRVKGARVSIGQNEVARISAGMLLFVGIGNDDTEEDLKRMARKIVNLRIFEDTHGKLNFNILMAGGQVLSVSQFTLYADLKKGNRPGFSQSAEPEKARHLWKEFNRMIRDHHLEVREGAFGEHMDVELVNDGPVTVWLDSKE